MMSKERRTLLITTFICLCSLLVYISFTAVYPEPKTVQQNLYSNMLFVGGIVINVVLNIVLNFKVCKTMGAKFLVKLIKRLAKEGASEGTLALAEFQSAGRGRLGRSWEVPEGTSVMMSILLRPKFEPQYAPTLTLVMGMAVAKAVKNLGFDVSIKWPNDVVVSHKKICGILTEMGVRDGKIDYAVIGVGINVNIKEFPEEMADKATSLYLESGKEFDRSQIPGLVMEAFEEYYEKFAATCDLSGLKEEYESILANYNQPVRVLAKEPYEGVARGITDGGELLVEKTDGTIVAVSAGEVSVRGLYSYV